MFNPARIKTHFKTEVRSAKMTAPEPKTKISRRAMARIKAQKIAEDYKKLFRKHYFGGQFYPLRPIPSERTDFSKSAAIHTARVASKIKTRKEMRLAKKVSRRIKRLVAGTVF